MTRQAFMARLREGLRGLPPQAQADIAADYEAHFEDGKAAGRSEEAIAAALGDPYRLARELRAEAGLRRWEERPNASGAVAAIFALLGLGALDVIILLPILMGVGSVMFAGAIVVVILFLVGAAVFAAGPFTGMPGGPAAAILAGVGLMTGAASGGAILALVTIGIINALVWYARLHFRLLKPTLQPDFGAAP